MTEMERFGADCLIVTSVEVEFVSLKGISGDLMGGCGLFRSRSEAPNAYSSAQVGVYWNLITPPVGDDRPPDSRRLCARDGAEKAHVLRR